MAKLDRLTDFLSECGQKRLVVSLDDVERLIGEPLIPSARVHAAFWSNSEKNRYSRAWRRAGYRASRSGVSSGHIAFDRLEADPRSAHEPRVDARSELSGAVTQSAAPSGTIPPGPTTVILVGCVKTKAEAPRPARDLYISELFSRRRDYAEAAGIPWYILSAKHGLLEPDEVVEPYDVTLKAQEPQYQKAWGEWVVARLSQELGSLAAQVVEVHAGAAYLAAIAGPLERSGAGIKHPFAGLRLGAQLAWYGRTKNVFDSPVEDLPLVMHLVDGPEPAEVWEHTWPDGSRQLFDSGWQLVVAAGSARRTVRHLLGQKEVYGRPRRASVTFLGGDAVAEGTAVDTYASTRTLCSLVKGPTGQLVQEGSPLPAPYRDFDVVTLSQRIAGPQVKPVSAVELAEDDVVGWARVALARRGITTVVPAHEAPNITSVDHFSEPSDQYDPNAVVAGLVRLGSAAASRMTVGPSFTPDAEANAFVSSDPFAFLLGVIFDQGIVAERAWEAPYRLFQRLGHLDPERLAADPSGVSAAVVAKPMLHRYIQRVPGWVCEAARIVMTSYGGDAANIWNDSPTARELHARLDAFPGIGQKKAAMGVEILARDLGVTIRELSGSDVAYDVHVRRVFLRTGLAQHDDMGHMLQVARRFHPERPGVLDEPAWRIGREYCHAGIPNCGRCPLGDVCPKLIETAARVRGN